MSLIQWTDKLSVNVASIDAQHKNLVALLNELHDAMKAGKSHDVLSKTLDRLVDYTKTHFAHEEVCMTKTCFAGLKDHKCQHDDLAKTVLKFQADFKAGKTGVTIEVLTFLQNWISNHILKTDKLYSAHLNSHKIC